MRTHPGLTLAATIRRFTRDHNNEPSQERFRKPRY